MSAKTTALTEFSYARKSLKLVPSLNRVKWKNNHFVTISNIDLTISFHYIQIFANYNMIRGSLTKTKKTNDGARKHNEKEKKLSSSKLELSEKLELSKNIFQWAEEFRKTDKWRKMAKKAGYYGTYDSRFM